MKKWSGGLLIIGLAAILVLRYSFLGKLPARKQSAYDFFHPHSSNDANLDIDQRKILHRTLNKSSLVDVEGLIDLYSLSNISKEESTALLVWPQMRTILSRSDALPETAQGIKEASIAWKELLSSIEIDKASKLRNESGIQENKYCDYSVSTFNTTKLTTSNILEIPCGLIDGSSITVIGIPDGQQDSFQIELIGLQLPEEPKHAVVLHYNVFLPGENLTGESVIVQNTWTNEHGWGKEERCPDRGNSSFFSVDGLAKCSAQVIRSTLEEISNASHPNGDKLANISDGGIHMSSNFPFVEGNPFTATLWVGEDGFHMTVNGRHETSFAYREKLEPWLVNAVRVGGGVNLISALAKGLPVSEDLGFAVDVDRLKAPPTPKRRIVMLIGVFSAVNNFERRMALRRSWMQYDAVRTGDVAVRFFIGLNKNKRVNFELWREAQAYGDIQLMPFLDYYSLLSLKTIAICIMGTKILPAKYIMKMDDDAFVRIDVVLSSLKTKVSDGLLYGHVSFESAPHRDKDNKWYISDEEWPHATYPPWAHGPGYIISRDIAKFVVRGHQERDLKNYCSDRECNKA